MDIKTFLEEAADLEHQRWAGWQKYLHSLGAITPDGCFLAIPLARIKSWERQIKTPYSELSEEEKESDRKEVRKYFPILKALMLSVIGEEEEEPTNIEHPHYEKYCEEVRIRNEVRQVQRDNINKMFEEK